MAENTLQARVVLKEGPVIIQSLNGAGVRAAHVLIHLSRVGPRQLLDLRIKGLLEHGPRRCG